MALKTWATNGPLGSGPISGFNIKPLAGWTGVKALRGVTIHVPAGPVSEEIFTEWTSILNPGDELCGAQIRARDNVPILSWLMLRGSGTEPILRIYAEARADADAQKLLGLGVRLTKAVA